MSLKVANALRNKFYEEDTPFVFNVIYKYYKIQYTKIF